MPLSHVSMQGGHWGVVERLEGVMVIAINNVVCC